MRRYEPVTDRVLAFLRAREIRGTFFVVGELAERSPDLVRRIRSAGHEIGLHGYRHVALDKLGEDGFRNDVERGKETLEAILDQGVIGYRAPMFSLTGRTPWAPGVLCKLGFAYSSSVLPAPNPVHGYPGKPRTPFRWECGLLELPCPLMGRADMAIPFLGGVYLRYVPAPVLRLRARRTTPEQLLWTYLHPYDFDHGAPFVRLPHAGWLTSRIVQSRRRSTYARVEWVLDTWGTAPPLGERARAVA